MVININIESIQIDIYRNNYLGLSYMKDISISLKDVKLQEW